MFVILTSLFTATTNCQAQHAVAKSKMQVKDSIEYYPGDIKTKGKYVDGLKNGVFEFYGERKEQNIDGHYARRLDSTVTYQMGKRNGIKTTYEQFYLQEVVQSTENYVNDKLDGNSVYWHTSLQVDCVKTFNQGRLVKEVKYPRDTTLLGIYFQIHDFPNDTVYQDRLKKDDSVIIDLIGYADRNWDVRDSDYPTKSLSGTGFKIKSFLLVMYVEAFDLEQPFIGDRLPLRRVKSAKPGEWFYITNVIVSDPNGFECKLPDQKFVVR